MSYDLEAIPAAPPAPPLDLEALCARALNLGVARNPGLPPPRVVRPNTVASDGRGFTVELVGRTLHFSALPARSLHDERWMEYLALAALDGKGGEVVDKHTGRHWPEKLLTEWLSVTGLFSGRVLAMNEERIAHSLAPTAAAEFAARAEALAAYASSERASPALRARLHDELSYYATRRSMSRVVARALAATGDFERLEALTRVPGDGDHAAALDEAFTLVAEYGAKGLEIFSRALSDPDPNHRRAAARALHRVKDPGVLPLAVLALADKRSTVREAVLESDVDALLALPGGAAALAPALRRLATDTSSTVRKLAARWTARLA